MHEPLYLQQPFQEAGGSGFGVFGLQNRNVNPGNHKKRDGRGFVKEMFRFAGTSDDIYLGDSVFSAL